MVQRQENPQKTGLINSGPINTGFILRFVLITVICAAIAFVFSRGGSEIHDITASITFGAVATLLIFVLLWCSAVLIALWLLSRLGESTRLTTECIIAWVATVTISAIFYLIFEAISDISTIKPFLTGTSLPAYTGLSLLVLSACLTPLVFCLEQKFRQNELLAQKNTTADNKQSTTSLQDKIKPHFLFNSLNNIIFLTRLDPDKAETALYNLSDLLRAGLTSGEQYVTLKSEIELVNKYLYLEKIRLGDRFESLLSIEDGLEQIMLPQMLMMPLIGSAIYNSVETANDRNIISTSIRQSGQQAIIDITSSVPDEEDGRKRIADDKKTLLSKLKSAFGDEASVETYETEEQYTIVFKIPMKSLN